MFGHGMGTYNKTVSKNMLSNRVTLPTSSHYSYSFKTIAKREYEINYLAHIILSTLLSYIIIIFKSDKSAPTISIIPLSMYVYEYMSEKDVEKYVEPSFSHILNILFALLLYQRMVIVAFTNLLQY